ncbi:MAG: protein kinase, partial [Pirellulaceae bacterium]
MPDEPQTPDNLDQDRTFVGERKKVSGDTRSLNVDATRGDAGDSSKDDFQQALEAFDEVVDLAKRYDVKEKLGAGGMGTVLKAVDRRLGRTVALKFLLEELGDSAQALRRFITEAKAIAMLNHNNIVQIYEMERSAEGPFIVMEYVQGGSLVDLLGDGPLDQGTAVDIICQVCDALGVAHDRDIIHRDIKPANILITTDGVPKLSDFGLARQTTADHGQTQVGAVLGTIDFMPPEQRQDATAVDARSDLWSLAATLYQMVTGRSPKVIRLDLVDDSLRPILAQALEDAQEDRYQSAAEFRDALRASLQATDSGVMVDVDLGSGECPACHTKNDMKVKFCRGCGESLQVACLSCKEPIAVWDNFCTDCSGNQKELLIALREEIDAKRTSAETLGSELAFDKALEIAGEIADIQDTRLQHLKEWSGTFTEETTAEKERQRQHATDRDLEAIKHREAYDYRSAIQAIETIPEAMRTEDISARLKQLQSDLEESDELLSQIRACLKDKELDGLLDLVDRAVELRGDREDLQKLQVKLLNREETIARERDSAARQVRRRAPLAPTPELISDSAVLSKTNN